MARVLAIVLSTLFLLAVSVSAARSFEETGYIVMVTDKIQNLESNLVKILGTNPKSLLFAEFAVRYGKRYDSVHQLVHRFNVFVKNVELIESRNRMKLPYTLAINGTALCFPGSQVLRIPLFCLNCRLVLSKMGRLKKSDPRYRLASLEVLCCISVVKNTVAPMKATIIICKEKWFQP